MLLLLLTATLLLPHINHVYSGPVREEKKAPKENFFTKTLKYMESNPETLDELMNDGRVIAEGDMVMQSDRNAVKSIWPTHDIPYGISQEIEYRTEDILAAMAMVSVDTCISFTPRTTEEDYLYFVNSRGCSSYIGWITGEQQVYVGPQCGVGNVVHEILHALGFYHEHTRSDRTKYVTIYPENIMDGQLKNFKISKGETFGIGYDHSSILHYGSGFFSENGLQTIESKFKNVTDMGQRERMTEKDIHRVRLLYSCDAEKEPEENNDHVEKNQTESNVTASTQKHAPNCNTTSGH